MITAGLASRRHPGLLPPPYDKEVGDALWAVAVFVAIRLIAPGRPTLSVTILAVVIPFAIEFSQAIHVSWLDRLRAHGVGHLLLGSGFSPLDLVAYVVGVAGVVPVDLVWLRRRR